MRGRGYGDKGTGARPKDLEFYIYPMTSAKFNPNNDDVELHKGSLFPTLAQTKGAKLWRACLFILFM